MDLGAVGFDDASVLGSDHEATKQHKWYGSGFLMKQERSNTATATATEEEDDEYWRSNKVAKTDEKSMAFQQRNSLLRSNTTLFSDGQQMLSFSSSPKPSETSFLVDKSSPNAAFSYPYLHLSTCNRNNNNTGYSSGSMHGIIAGTRGPFTPSQWMELEHQALIYKYITANVPVPSHLLVPIKKALESAGFCNFSAAFLRPNPSVGWGGFHLGFSNSTDPEPGRCRRTDGKKWRCSRDAVVDQKYCERHMNRGRHRSRKPVEGQSGHALTTTTTSTTTTTTSNANNAAAAAASKLMMMSNNNVVLPGGTASNSLAFAQQQDQPNKNMHTLASDTCATNTINRMFMSDKENNGSERRIQDSDALPMLPPTLGLKSKENNNHSFMIHKQQQFPYEESSRNEFGLVTSDSLLNPSQKSSSLISSSRTFGSSHNRETDSQHSLRHFIDDWPKLDMQSERTELSISIPMTASTDFMSSTSSPTNNKVTLSPLRLSREFDPIQMGLGVGNNLNDSNNNSSRHHQANWIPVSWESSMGGPLGEVLNVSNNNNNNAASDHHQCGANKSNTSSSSALNLMTNGWDNSPPLGGSSPTGVLQKTAFGSLSNSSAGSSPRAENSKTQEGASLCNDLLTSTLGNSSL